MLLQSVLSPDPADTYVIDGGTEPVNPGVLSDRFTSVRRLAHVRGVTFHSLRKYFATTLLSAEVPVHAVARAGGWKSTRMVLNVYGRATKSGADQAADVELLPMNS
jgi:integrase